MTDPVEVIIAKALLESTYGDTHSCGWNVMEKEHNISEQFRQRLLRMARAALDALEKEDIRQRECGRAAAAEARLARAREALQFYADEWFRHVVDGTPFGPTGALWDDKGDRARQALADSERSA